MKSNAEIHTENKQKYKILHENLIWKKKHGEGRENSLFSKNYSELYIARTLFTISGIVRNDLHFFLLHPTLSV